MSICHQQIFVSCVGGAESQQFQPVSISTNSISKVLSSIIRSSVCLRMTPVGLAPFVSDITLVLPYTHMTQLQINFLHDILHRATFNASPNTADPIKAIAYSSEVVIITCLNSQCIWSGTCLERHALQHTFVTLHPGHSSSSAVAAAAASSNSNTLLSSGKKNKRAGENGEGSSNEKRRRKHGASSQQNKLVPAVACEQAHSQRKMNMQAMQEASMLVQGNPAALHNSTNRDPHMQNSAHQNSTHNSKSMVTESEKVAAQHKGNNTSAGHYQLDMADVLKAFCACVFRSKIHKDNSLREGICNVILQMVIGEVGITRDILQSVSRFIQTVKNIE